MIAYLTSHIGGYVPGSCSAISGNASQSSIPEEAKIPTQLNTENGFLESLQKNWKRNADVLILSSDPDALEKNNGIKKLFATSFPVSGLSIGQLTICDRRNENIVEKIADYDAVILSGGHVPTQNVFFKRYS